MAVEKACAGIGGDHWRWRYGGRMVPRLVFLVDPGGDGLAHNPACRGDRGTALRPRVRRAFLAPDDHQLAEELTPDDHTQFRRLAAVIWQDLGSLPRPRETFQGPSLGDVLGITDERTIRARVQEGRWLWAQLAAWPWSLWPNGEPPMRWHRDGPDAAEAAAFFTWREGEAISEADLRERWTVSDDL